MEKKIEDLEKSMKRSNDKQLKIELELCQKVGFWSYNLFFWLHVLSYLPSLFVGFILFLLSSFSVDAANVVNGDISHDSPRRQAS